MASDRQRRYGARIRWLTRLAWIGFVVNLIASPGEPVKILLICVFGVLIVVDVAQTLWTRKQRSS